MALERLVATSSTATGSSDWTISGGDPTFHEAIDDGIGKGDSTYIENSNTSITITNMVSAFLEDPTGVPITGVNWTALARVKLSESGNPAAFEIRVKEGGTTHLNMTLTDVLSGATWETKQEAFDPSGVSNANDLYFEITGHRNFSTPQVADLELLIEVEPYRRRTGRAKLIR